jgi:hypothetical protein
MKDTAFVFVSCGEQHATRLRTALRFLRHFSQAAIVVVSRTGLEVDCDEFIAAQVPSYLDDHRASIFMKTSLHKILPAQFRKFCYLDNDVIAVSSGVDDIFRIATSPISFAADHCTLGEFGRYAVNCHCKGPECEHLQSAIHQKFGVEIKQTAWRHWNGGVFVFDVKSAEFMELWHQNILSIFSDPYWKTRDQGALVATVWKLGLQSHPTLPQEFNFIVDRFKLDVTPFSEEKAERAGDLPPSTSYSLHSGGSSMPRPFFLHFINDGVDKRGWKNWDEVELLLSSPDGS